MATESSTNDDTGEKTYAEKTFPNPTDVLELMVSMQRLNQQLMWQMGEAMADMIAMPLRRDRTERNKPGPFNRAVTDLRDAVDSATETLQQGGKPR